MKYCVTFALKPGAASTTATLEAIAPTKAQAEERAAYRCEILYGPIERTLRVLRSS